MSSLRRYIIFCLAAILFGCKDDTSHLFTKLSSSHTGVNFKNLLVENENANVLNYAYFYNGGGVAIGDINGDGLPDILFTGNMVPNRLYLNKGNFQFEDITEKSGIASKQGWCTGATMVDINGDGKPDIYICRSADDDPERRKNLLFINNGDLTFTEKAEEYGLADEGYSTQAVFFDYDKDGDLDMFLVNHSLQQYANESFQNSSLRNQHRPEFACKLYRNDNGHFTDVSAQAGITSNVLTFGLGVAVSDINNDGWPDIYVSNDFNEPDYLFMNNHNGTFTEKLNKAMDEVSLYSMGSDFADINNDGLPDLMTLDMLPEGNFEQKMHSGAENFDKFQMLFNHGFYYQYSRNMLQKNNGDGTFSEIGQMAGVSNTDWSWASLFSDFDNDGYKDLFVTNGYVSDFTNMDFMRYQITRNARQNVGEKVETTRELLDKMPSVTTPNYIYKNNGNSTFANKIKDWGFDEANISSGAVYADLNNDGKMDLVVSNFNEKASIYRNNGNAEASQNNYLKIKLTGGKENFTGIGTKVKVWCGKQQFYQEEFPVRGYQSSVDPVLNFGLGKAKMADSAVIIWPDDRTQKLTGIKAGQTINLKWKDATSKYVYPSSNKKKVFTETNQIPFTHKEKSFNNFEVQPLLPNYVSRQGPCITKADVNHDGREDVLVGGAYGQACKIYVQQTNGTFINRPEPALEKDSLHETVAAEFFDANGDGYPDLYLASGGYVYAENYPVYQDRLYLNDGKGNFRKAAGALPVMQFSKSCVKAADINNDGSQDLFVGGRVVPGKYPLSPLGMILLNDGKGHFKDATEQICPGLKHIGMVTDAAWADINGDGKPDLVVVGEWMPIKVFINHDGRLVDESSSYIKFPSTGFWNRIMVDDLDGDGKPDLVIGNTGLNTQFHVSAKEPMTLYYKDFDGNGSIDPILCYYINGVSYPAASRDDIADQLPGLKKKFPDYASYANARLKDIFTPDQLKHAGYLKAECMETVCLLNRGIKGFVKVKLPVEAQYSPVYAIAAVSHSGKKDLVLAGNNSWTRIKFGRYKANHGVLLSNDGKGNFTYVPQPNSGLNLREDIRCVQIVKTGTCTSLFFGANNTEVKTYKLNP